MPRIITCLYIIYLSFYILPKRIMLECRVPMHNLHMGANLLPDANLHSDANVHPLASRSYVHMYLDFI